MKKLVFRFFLNAKKGFKKYIKKKSLSSLREKIANLHNENIISSKEEFYGVPKQRIFNQYLGQKLLYSRFLWVYLFFYSKNSKVIFPLPGKWQKSLDENGTKISKTFSSILYCFLLLYSFSQGIYFFFKIIVKYINYNFFKKTQISFKEFTIFRNISTNRININSKTQYNLIKWYKEKIDNNANIILFSNLNKNKQYNNKLAEANDDLFLFYKDFNIYKFIFLFFQLLLEFRRVSLIEYNLLLFKDLIELNFYKSLKINKINKVLFVWTNNIYKPLWIYELENKDTEVNIFFNGCLNEIRLDSNLKLDHDHEGLKNMTWSNYFTWDETNSKFLIQKIETRINVQITGPNYFSDNDKNFEFPKKSIVVFGYENHKRNIGINTITDYEYCNKDFLKRFYDDIYDVAIKNDFNIVVKRKNQLNNLEIKKNKFFFNNFFLRPNVISIDPNISAFRIIEKSDIIISMPFTSTGLIGSMYDKKSIYYDPFKWIQKNDPSGSNLTLLSGKDELEKWLYNIKK